MGCVLTRTLVDLCGLQVKLCRSLHLRENNLKELSKIVHFDFEYNKQCEYVIIHQNTTLVDFGPLFRLDIAFVDKRFSLLKNGPMRIRIVDDELHGRLDLRHEVLWFDVRRSAEILQDIRARGFDPQMKPSERLEAEWIDPDGPGLAVVNFEQFFGAIVPVEGAPDMAQNILRTVRFGAEFCRAYFPGADVDRTPEMHRSGNILHAGVSPHPAGGGGLRFSEFCVKRADATQGQNKVYITPAKFIHQ